MISDNRGPRERAGKIRCPCCNGWGDHMVQAPCDAKGIRVDCTKCDGQGWVKP